MLGSQVNTNDTDHLPPPPAFLLQPESDTTNAGES